MKFLVKRKGNDFVLIDIMCVGKTLNMDSWFKFWENLEGIWGNPGEMPHIGWKISGVYRVNAADYFHISPKDFVRFIIMHPLRTCSLSTKVCIYNYVINVLFIHNSEDKKHLHTDLIL